MPEQEQACRSRIADLGMKLHSSMALASEEFWNMRPGLSMEVTIDHNMCVPESCCPRLYPLSMLSVYRRAGALVKRYHRGLLGAPWASPPPRLNVVLSSPRRYAVLIIRLWPPR